METSITGRDSELAAVRRLFESERSLPAAVLLEGEPGIGKSMLWREGTHAARELGFCLLTSRPAEAEAGLAYATLGDLLPDELEPVANALPAPQRRALEIALLLIDAGGSPPDPRAIAVAVLGVIRALSAKTPLAIAIDDVQWVDGDSGHALAFALRRLVDEPVALLLARRDGPGALVPLGLDRAFGESHFVRVRLRALNVEAIHRLLAERIAVRLAQPELKRVHATARGNPLYALEIGRALADGEGKLPAGSALPVPEALADVLAERLTRLSPVARAAVLVAAMLAHPTPELIAKAIDHSTDALEEAVDAAIVEIEGDRVRFAHPLLAAVLYSRCPPDRRRALHRRLADVVADPIERAAHLARGTDRADARIAHALDDAARRAAARGAPEAALELAEHARRLMPVRRAEERMQLSCDASDYALAAGDTERAERLLVELLPSCSGRVRIEALIRLATLSTYAGSIRAAREFARQALAEDGAGPALAVVVHRRLSLAELLLGELEDAHRHAQVAAELAERTGDPSTLGRALANLAFLRALRGREDWHADLERAISLETTPGLASIDDSPTAILGLVLMYQGDFDRARAHLEASLDARIRHGGDALSTGLLFALSELETRAGRFELAAALAQRGLDACEQAGQTTERAVLLFVRALADAHLGRESAARAAAHEGLTIAVDLPRFRGVRLLLSSWLCTTGGCAQIFRAHPSRTANHAHAPPPEPG